MTKSAFFLSYSGESEIKWESESKYIEGYMFEPHWNKHY